MSDDVVPLERGRANALRDEFLGWQCRLRQLSVRQNSGRPGEGMSPTLSLDGKSHGRIVTVIARRNSTATTAEFRHMVRRTHDPNERHKAALQYLSAAYYQSPKDFLDTPLALFALDSALAAKACDATECILHFAQYTQRYDLPCKVTKLATDDEAYQATYWHNALFNPTLPAATLVLSFRPDWIAGCA